MMARAVTVRSMTTALAELPAPAEVLRSFGDAEVIPFPALAAKIAEAYPGPLGIAYRPDRSRLLATGLIQTAPDAGPGRPKSLPRSEALEVLWAALLAVALGVGIAAILRGAANLGIKPSDFASAALKTTP
jgi:hypothetical protein